MCRVCSHHCMKVSCGLFVTPWNNFSSFSSSSTFLLTRPLNELLFKSNTGHQKLHSKDYLSSCCIQSKFIGMRKYLTLALPLLFFCVLPFLVWGGGWTASFTASSQKPILELCVSPQTLLESDPQLVEMLVFIDPHTEVLRGVWEWTKLPLMSSHTHDSTVPIGYHRGHSQFWSECGWAESQWDVVAVAPSSASSAVLLPFESPAMTWWLLAVWPCYPNQTAWPEVAERVAGPVAVAASAAPAADVDAIRT